MPSGKNVEMLKISLEYFLASAGTVSFFGTVVSTSVEIEPWILLILYGAVGLPFAVYGGYSTHRRITLEAEEKKISAIKIENLSKQEENKINQLKKITEILVPGHADDLVTSFQTLNVHTSKKPSHSKHHPHQKKPRSSFNIQISGGAGSSPVALTIGEHKKRGNINVTMNPSPHLGSTPVPSTPSTQLITNQLLTAASSSTPAPTRSISVGTPVSKSETELMSLGGFKLDNIVKEDDENLDHKMRM
jgi:hypothetical protein